MIHADFLTGSDGRITGFRIAGHSDYAEDGNDIVCAAVSSVVFMTINTVTDVIGVQPLAMRVEDGETFFRLEIRDEALCRDILAGLKLHLLGLEEQYPQNISVSYLEV